MATKITSIGNHAAAFLDGPGILSPVRFLSKGVKVPVYWNYLPAVELMLKKTGAKTVQWRKLLRNSPRRLGLIWMLANFLMSVKM
ncbi:hypothetical protein IE981_08040 [Klebsiella pneumoniae]|nr:hypothetical protein [Klebsiella pneumoniae]